MGKQSSINNMMNGDVIGLKNKNMTTKNSGLGSRKYSGAVTKSSKGYM